MAIYLQSIRTEERTRYIAQMSDLSDLVEEPFTAYIATVVTDTGASVEATFDHHPTDAEIVEAVTPGRPLG